ncbi:uncharacterized protein C4orf45 [Carassius gibelio]|uniref:uncharacterized protein C4orf45 n=1 Tax=Carassius gibelio TaxID=101364 RepID=UPI00227790F2|nr:uncharacterized protein C4orf45 [Carassius gibelio]
MMKKFQQDTTPSQAETQSSSGQRILFTGPDGIGDFLPRLDSFPHSIGVGPLSPDATSDLSYLFRPPPHTSPPLPRHCFVGDVGWGLQYSTTLNRRSANNMRQNQSQLTCGTLAWNHSTHDAYSEDDNKLFPLNQQRQSVHTKKAQPDDQL